MKKTFFKILAGIILTLVFACESNDATEVDGAFNYVTFESTSYNLGVDIDSEATETIKVYSSKVTGSDRTFSISIDENATTADADSYTIPTSVTIPAGSNEGDIEITVEDLNIDDGKMIVLSFDEDSSADFGDDITINVSQVCPNTEVILNLSFDAYPDEVYWVLTDSTGSIVAESLTPSDYGAYTGYTESILVSFCLESGDYTFSIYDSYGDGAGAYFIYTGSTTLYSSDGAYEGGEQITFSI